MEAVAGELIVDTTTRTGPVQLAKRGAGTLILDRANSHSGGTVVEAGEVIVRNISALGTGTLKIRAGATVTLDVGHVAANGGTNFVALSRILLDPTGRLELGTGQIRVAAGNYDLELIRAALVSGRDEGAWNGATGFTSGSAGPGSSRAIGYRVTPSGELHLGFAAAGDLDMNGVVDLDDVIAFVASGVYDAGLPAVWAQGDYDYNGIIDLDDVITFVSGGLYDQASYLPAAAPAAQSFAQSLAVDNLSADTSLLTPLAASSEILDSANYQNLTSATEFSFTELLDSQESFWTYFRQGDNRGEFFYDAQAATLRSSGPYELAEFQVARRWTEFQFDIKVSALSFGSFDVRLTNGTNQYVIKLDGVLPVGPNWRTVRIAYDEATRTLNAFIDGVQSKQASVVAANWNTSFDCTLASGGGQNAIITLRNTKININQAPTDIALSANTIAENTGANAVVGTLSTTDLDTGNTFTYTLVTGTGSTDNAAFNISGNQLRATVSFDFEAKSSYSVRIRSTDQGGLFTEKAFTITVVPVSTITVGTGQTVADTTVRTGTAQLVKQGVGTLILELANTHSGGTVVEAGDVVVRHVGALGPGTVVVKPGARLTLDVGTESVSLSGLDIHSGALVDVGTGRIVLGAGAFDLATIRGQLAAGHGANAAPGAIGISSSAAAAPRRAVGHVFDGEGNLVVGFAAAGDLDMNGVVDLDDVIAFVASGVYDAGLPAVWAQGDYDYNGIIDLDDVIAFVSGGLYDQGSYLPAAAPAAAQSSIVAAPLTSQQASAPEASFDLSAAAFASLAKEQQTTDDTSAKKKQAVRIA